MEDSDDPETLTFYPFAYALLDTELTNYCWYCLGDEERIRKCTGCQTAYFCSKQCQKFGWKDHRPECKGFHLLQTIPNIEVRLLGRIVTRFKAIENGRDKNDLTFYTDRTSERSIMQLWSHTEDMRSEQRAWTQFETIFTELSQFYGEQALLSKEVIFELHCRDFINRHAISDKAYMKEIGKGLYLDLCAYNHSCEPNTIYTCNGFVATLRKLNKSVHLKDKTNTFYSYINLFATKEQRKKMLKDTWYFDCQCKRCEDNAEHILTSMKCPFGCATPLCIFGEQTYKNGRTQEIICPKCVQSVSKDAVLEAFSAMRFIDQLVDGSQLQEMPDKQASKLLSELIARFSPLLPNVNIYYCYLLQALIGLSADDLQTQLQCHIEAEQCMRVCYPASHPSLIYHLMSIGSLHLNMKHKVQAVQYLTEARDHLQFVLGNGHPMLQSNRSQLEIAQNLP